MVEYWGSSMAEGFLHDFEGWIVFMACTALLVLEMWFLAKVGRDQLPLHKAFGIDFPEPVDKDSEVAYRTIAPEFIVSGLLVLVAALVATLMPERIEIRPERKSFTEYSMTFPGWRGREDQLESVILDELRLTDYLLADYVSDLGKRVNLYVAYYASQRQGESAHSPRTCLPGGGWKIKSLTVKTVNGVAMAGVPLHVNRALIQKGEYRQLVYYWFQQRSRIITNEYLVKYLIFWDSLTKKRSDGALVRLTYLLPPGSNEADADRILTEFASEIAVALDDYIPK
jgi:exosortase D (VPLPA-CTERM-specific)